MEILILHPGGLGDVILSLPAIALIRNRYPSSRVTVAGNIDHLEGILSGYADQVLPISSLPLHRLYASGSVPESDAKFWRSFDWIVSWTGANDSVFSANFHGIHPNVLIAPWRPAPEEERHVAQIFVDSLKPTISTGRELISASVRLDAKLRDEGTKWLIDRGWNGNDSLIALHPGAGSPAKRWPLDRFIDLAQRLMSRPRIRLAIIEGPAEPELGLKIAQALPATRAILADVAPLSPLAAVLVQCDVFIGNDSGLAHLAAALNVSSIVLFGPTRPQHWTPLGQRVIAVQNTRGCEGCASRMQDHTCLENITVEEVVRTLRAGIWT